MTTEGIFSPAGKYRPTNAKIKVSIVSRIVSRINEVIKYEETFIVWVSEDDTISKLKPRLEYAVEKQDLFYNGKLLQDDQTMKNCGIGDGAKIFLRKKIKVTIKKDGTPRSLTIEETIRFIDLMSLFGTGNYKWQLEGGRIFEKKDLDKPLWAIDIKHGSKMTFE